MARDFSTHFTTLAVRHLCPVMAPLDPRPQREGFSHRGGAEGEDPLSQEAQWRDRQRWGFFSPSAL